MRSLSDEPALVLTLDIKDIIESKDLLHLGMPLQRATLIVKAKITLFFQQFPEPLEPQSTSRFLVWPFVNLHAIMRLKIHSIAPF
jgi:hypothetical protein